MLTIAINDLMIYAKIYHHKHNNASTLWTTLNVKGGKSETKVFKYHFLSDTHTRRESEFYSDMPKHVLKVVSTCFR